MRLFFKLVLTLTILHVACDSDNLKPKPEYDFIDDLTDGLCIVFKDSVVLNHMEIDYYDFSTHMIYLKNTHDFLIDRNWEDAYKSFSVYAYKEKIYSGSLHPGYSSSIPSNPYIQFPFRYLGYVIKISAWDDFFPQGSDEADPREDEKIIAALKDFNQYHAGLSCTLDEIAVNQSSQLSFRFTISNLDSVNYFILNPDKMGLGLFHYFTTGLTLYNETTRYLTHKISVVYPESRDSWNIEWLELLKGGESITFEISYSNFETIPSGQYRISFDYPGLINVGIEDQYKYNGKIWLGEIETLIEDFEVIQ